METQVWVTRNWQNLGVRPMMCKVFEEQGVFPRTVAEATSVRITAFNLGVDCFLTESEARASAEEERIDRIKELEAELSAMTPLCCNAIPHKHGGHRLRCPVCGKTWTPCPKERGRKPIHDVPMSATERKRRSRKNKTP